MTDRTDAQVIVLADYAWAQRKRARRFWGTMGVVLRLDDRRPTPTGTRRRGDVPRRRTAFETRASRGN